MKSFLLIVSILLSIPTMAQTEPIRQKPVITANLLQYDTLRDPKNNQLVYKGSFTIQELRKEPSFAWLQKGIDDYHPDTAVIGYLRQYMPGYEMRIFMGTWCEDSQNLIPKLFKVMLDLKQTLVTKRIIGLDRDKTTAPPFSSLVTDFKVTLVPTIILLKEGKEIGRITETVNKSIEADLADIIWKSAQ